jgi:transposase InsO family protein
MERGFRSPLSSDQWRTKARLVAIMDWYSRKVLAWRLSNTLEADFCVAAPKEALAAYGPPEIFNTGLGSQFTSSDWIDELKDAEVKISMDGKGRWIDNRMIERLWRSLNRRSAKRNTNAFICVASRPGRKPATVSANGRPITMPSGPTRPMAS